MLESNENLVITWTISSAYSLASQTVTVDGKAITPISGPYGGSYYSCAIGTWAVGRPQLRDSGDRLEGGQRHGHGHVYRGRPARLRPGDRPGVVSQAKGGISWNVLDADGVAGSTIAIDEKGGVERLRPVHRIVRRELLRRAWLALGRQPYLHDHGDRQAGQPVSRHGDFHHRQQRPGDQPVAVSETKDRISWNAFDPDGVAGSSVTIDGKTASSISGPFAASSGVNYSAPLGTLAAGDAHLHDYRDRQARQRIDAERQLHLGRTRPGPTISQVAVSQAKARISWNRFDTQGVKSSTLQIDGHGRGERLRALSRRRRA